MRGYNHIAGGVAFTGIFASFADVNLFARPEYLATCVFFALLPDVDHTKSILGKLFWPMAKWIDRHYGHRTVTHSLPFFLAVITAVGLLETFVLRTRVLTGITALALASHLLFDMCTQAGIPFFLPFTRARCVLPGNPHLRLSGTSAVAEAAVFFGFVLLILTTLPLMNNGFWVSINNEFATYTHVLREYERRSDVLHLDTREGLSGDVVSITENGAVIYDGRQFYQLREGQQHPASFRHTGRPRRTQRLEFAGIRADSLRAILKNPVLTLAATATQPIRYRVAGMQFEQASLKVDYPGPAFAFQEIEPDNVASFAQLARLRATLAGFAAASAKYRAEQARKTARIQHLKTAYPALSSYEQGKATAELAKLQAEVLAATGPPDNTTETQLTKAEIQRLKTSLANQKLTFTGVATIWNK